MSDTAVAVAALRSVRASDRAAVERLTRGSGLFREDEIPVAVEVFDAAAAGDPSYTALAAEVDGRVAGWICWGPTPCTLGTWDLYWMAVDPSLQGTGVGTALIREMEHRLAGLARMIVVETAGRADYAGTRAFYAARGYRAVATIPDFYAPGDDQIAYVKYLTSTAQ
jgi:GNAT superfamily N-acetyltransferase